MTSLNEREREFERDKGSNKNRAQRMEFKLQKKKDKIRQLIAESQEKDQEIERLKDEVYRKRSGGRANEEIDAQPLQKRSRSTINILHQEGEVEHPSDLRSANKDRLYEEEPFIANRMLTEQKVRESSYSRGVGTSTLEVEGRGPLQSESPGGNLAGKASELVRRSFKDVASYLTPNKSSSKSVNLTSQAAHSVFAIENIYKMIENCVKMECSGCRKLIPTHLFYDHLVLN